MGKSKEQGTAQSLEGSSRTHEKISKVVDQFVLEIDSLASTLPVVMTSITKAHAEASAALGRFITEHGRPVKGESSDGKRAVQFDATHAPGLQKRWRELDRAAAAAKLVPRSFLVSLVSQYDSYLGLLIEAILLSKPEILNGSERTISFPELVAFDSIEAARNHIVEKEVESVLRESHADQFDWLEKKFKLPLRKDLSIWPEFIEVTERRNLFVHSGGQVSGQYLKVCQLHKVDTGKTSKGDVLAVRPEYFYRAYATVFEIGVKLAHVLWRKLMPDDRRRADQNLVLISYNLLQQEKYELAKAILDFASEVIKTFSSADYRLRFVVNRAQAYKWSGDSARALEILDGEDFSALSDGFKLAAAVLRDDFEQALALVKTIGAQGDITLEDYREWPLFKEFRKEERLETIIAKIFKEPLNKINVKGGVPIAREQKVPLMSGDLGEKPEKNMETPKRRSRSRKLRQDETLSLIN